MSTAAVVIEVVEEHAGEAAFLWPQRDRASGSARYDLAALAALDDRVDAHLDGLALAGAAGWELCRSALDERTPGEVFAAAALAVLHRDLGGFAEVLDVAADDDTLQRAVASALGWLPFERAAPMLQGLLFRACPPALHRMGVAAHALHRRDPGPVLGEALIGDDAALKARAMRAAGELGRADLLPEIRAGFTAVDEPCRFWSAWSAALLGEPAAMSALRAVAEGGGPHAARACDMLVRRMDADSAAAWLEGLAARAPRTALVGAAALGSVEVVPWVLELTRSAPYARLAGAALTATTGVALAGALEGRPPADFEPGPTDEPASDDVALEPDEPLPWPEPAALADGWRRQKSAFHPGSRYLLGRPMAPAWLEQVLREGSQPARRAAALELSIRQKGAKLYETRAPGYRQLQQLGRSSG